MRLLSSHRSSQAALTLHGGNKIVGKQKGQRNGFSAGDGLPHTRPITFDMRPFNRESEGAYSSQNLQPNLKPASWMRRESDAPKLAWNKCGDECRWRSTNSIRPKAGLAVTDTRSSQLERSSRCLCGAVAVKLRDLRALCLPYQQTIAGLWLSAIQTYI